MLNINNQSEVYMICPAYNKTGGTELAHQLVYELNSIHINATICYYDFERYHDPINEAFNKYVQDYTTIDQVEDIPTNVIIVPEINVNLLEKFNRIQKAIWWMSVDNFQKLNGLKNSIHYLGKLQAFKHLIKHRIPLRARSIPRADVHFYQSFYACDFLEKHGVSNSIRLSDYINQEYTTNKTNGVHGDRLDQILYNPKKGISFTKKLIANTPDLSWVPLVNLSTEDVHKLLTESKVYVDFGNHPGKDRFPREAAISGCCVITGRRGSAQFYSDIPIPEKYKFSDKDSKIPAITALLQDCLTNYDAHSADFKEYQEMIMSERNQFKSDVRQAFLTTSE